VIAKIHIDLEDRTAEYLYNEYGQLIFCYLRISSPKYYEDTGRECGQERYYFHQQELIRLKIDPCPPTEGEHFEPLQKDAGITKSEEQAVLAVQRKAMEYKSLFDQITGIQTLESRHFSDRELELVKLGEKSTGLETGEMAIIQGKSAVFITPIHHQNDILEQAMGEEDFYTVVDDNLYYFSEAEKEVRQRNIQYYDPSERYIYFRKSNNQNVLIDRFYLVPGWYVLLFDGKKDPQKFSVEDISKALSSYFTP